MLLYKFTFIDKNKFLYLLFAFLIILSVITLQTYWFAFFIGSLWLFCEYFYRLPIHTLGTEKEIQKLDNRLGLLKDESTNFVKISSPCYGRIYDVEYTNEFIRIVTLLNVFDVHYQFAPIQGYISKTHYKKGTFYMNYMLEKSRHNERQHIIFNNDNGLEVEVIQIAGTLTQRIELMKKKMELVKQGEAYGLIHFGSRVDIIIPRIWNKKEFKLAVRPSQKIKGYYSTLGYY